MGDQTIDGADDLAAAVGHVRDANYRAATLIVPRQLTAAEAMVWRGEPRIGRVFAATPLPSVPDGRLQPIPQGGLVGAIGHADGVPVLAAPWPMLRLSSVFALLRRGKLSLACRSG